MYFMKTRSLHKGFGQDKEEELKSINYPVIFLRKSFPSWRKKNSNRSASALTSLGWMILPWDPQMAPWSCDSPLHLSMSAVQTLSAVKALVTVHRLTWFQHVPLRKITSHSLIPQSMLPSMYKFFIQQKNNRISSMSQRHPWRL